MYRRTSIKDSWITIYHNLELQDSESKDMDFWS